MVFFSKLRRSNPANVGPYSNHPAPAYASPYTAHRSTLHSQNGHSGHAQQASWESIPHPTFRASSEVSLPPEYTNVDIDTSRYPRSARAPPPAPRNSRILGAHRRRSDVHEDANLHKLPTESHLAPMLAARSTSIMWDVRESPAYMRHSRNARQSLDLSAPATSTQARRICLISHDFPYSIDVNGTRPLTVLEILEAIYEALGKEVRRSEWALASDSQRYTIQKANKLRRRADIVKRIRRVDWLGSRCMFRGLERDEALAKKRLMPGDDTLGETWVVRFSSRH